MTDREPATVASGFTTASSRVASTLDEPSSSQSVGGPDRRPDARTTLAGLVLGAAVTLLFVLLSLVLSALIAPSELSLAAIVSALPPLLFLLIISTAAAAILSRLTDRSSFATPRRGPILSALVAFGAALPILIAPHSLARILSGTALTPAAVGYLRLSAAAALILLPVMYHGAVSPRLGGRGPKPLLIRLIIGSFFTLALYPTFVSTFGLGAVGAGWAILIAASVVLILHILVIVPKRPRTGVETLMGDPKRAVVRLSIPMVLAMSVQTIYNLVDAIWVAGLGTEALGAVGFFFPFFFMIMAIATGIGLGGGSAISRRIGAKDTKGANNVASHTFVIMTIFGLAFTLPAVLFSRPLFAAIGASATLDQVVAYAEVLFGATLVIFFAQIANAVLRAEGDVNRAMYAMVIGGILNIILDPIFIYTFQLGVAGAAWATALSIAVTSTVMFYWLFIKRDTYVSIHFRGFRFQRGLLRDIFRVGFPASIQQLSMSFTMLFLNVIIVGVGGETGVAIFQTGWRVVTIAILPLLGMSTAVVSITGAAYGRRDYPQLETALMYAIKIGVVVEVAAAALTFLFAPQITSVFARSADVAAFADELIEFLRIMIVFYPFVALGIFSSAMFQGTGKGINALLVTLLRTIVLQPPLALALAYGLNLGLNGVWWGLVVGNTIGVIVAFVWAKHYLRSVKRYCKGERCDEREKVPTSFDAPESDELLGAHQTPETG